MSYTFILEKKNLILKGYINEYPTLVIESTCIPSAKLKLKDQLKKVLGTKLKNVSIQTIIKFN